VFVPNFASTDNVVEVIWKVPDNMRVILVLTIQNRLAQWCVSKSYLYCVDSRPEYWRLPLANIYEDGSICEGRPVNWFGSLLEAVADMLTTFDHSRWTSHLWTDHDKSQRMFRFKAIADGKFETLPCGSWITMANKVVVTDVQRNILL
jgi:hypothetical protein